MQPTPAGSINVTDALATERAAFLDLMRSLDDEDWRRPTECPAYDVQGVAAHILGDDLSLLSRQRDSARPGLLDFVEAGIDFRAALDQFNDRWVEAAQFFSPALLIELLELTGRWTADWYRTVDPESLGEPVGFFATGPSPYWQISAREYVERWVHHHQIRRALGRPDLDDTEILQPALAVVARGLAAHLQDLGAEPDDSIALVVDGVGAWTLLRDGERWQLLEGSIEPSTSRLLVERDDATPAFSKGRLASEVEAMFSLEGNMELGRRAVRAIAAFAGR